MALAPGVGFLRSATWRHNRRWPYSQSVSKPAKPSGVAVPSGIDSYSQAVEELETILERLDDGRIDVDLLTAEVGRAAELLAFCRTRLAVADIAVERIVATLRTEEDLVPGRGTLTEDGVDPPEPNPDAP